METKELEAFKSELEDTCGAIVSAGLDSYEARLNSLDGKVKWLGIGTCVVIGLVVVETRAVVQILNALKGAQAMAEQAAQHAQQVHQTTQAPIASKADYDPGPQDVPEPVKAVLKKTKEVIPSEPVE